MISFPGQVLLHRTYPVCWVLYKSIWHYVAVISDLLNLKQVSPYHKC